MNIWKIEFFTLYLKNKWVECWYIGNGNEKKYVDFSTNKYY